MSEDWEASTGLTHDIFLTTDQTLPEASHLRERFWNKPIFLEVVEALFELDQGKDVKLRKRAQHRASEYLIDEGKLWKLAGGHQSHA